MKRFVWTFAVLAALVATMFVACSRNVPAIDKLVTDAVIDEAVNGLADDIVAGEDGKWSDTKANGITFAACMKARHSVFAAKMGRDWFDELYASIAASPNFDQNDYWMKHGGSKDTYKLYRWIMETARQSLDTPAELKAAYTRHKAMALKYVTDAGIQTEVRDRILAVLPYFTGTRPAVVVTMEAANAYEFAERRRAEGGDALVAAYAEILKDFASSL